MAKGLIIGVDASRNRSGGARSHLHNLMSGCDPREYRIEAVHLWAYSSLMNEVDDQPWLVKHHTPELEGSVLRQMWWQFHSLPGIVRGCGCDVLYNTDAGSICRVGCAATLSQDMLSFEPGEMQRYGLSLARLRLETLKYVQARSLKKAQLAIFLTDYARRMIQNRIGPLTNTIIIPHGVGDRFLAVAGRRRPWPSSGPLQCLYISNAAPYKHQWRVVEAIAMLRRRGYDIKLTLAGGGDGWSHVRLAAAIRHHDPDGRFVRVMPLVPNSEIPDLLAASDFFVFASSCENMPITLLEAMASGIAICSSNRGPMPEVLADGGLYFDPERPASIADAVCQLIDDAAARERVAGKARQLAQVFTWSRCAHETWKALAQLAQSAAEKTDVASATSAGHSAHYT